MEELAAAAPAAASGAAFGRGRALREGGSATEGGVRPKGFRAQRGPPLKAALREAAVRDAALRRAPCYKPAQEQPVLPIFLATYGAVFVAEIVGDKLLYTTSVLATRYRPTSIVSGMAAAFMVKMGVAIVIGAAISQLPRGIVATVTALTFVGVALTLWRKPDERQPKEKDSRVLRGALVAFAAIVFSEWGDVGQVTAAGMAVKYVWSASAGTPGSSSVIATAFVVWLGAVAAMVTKGSLAAFLGTGVRLWIAERVSPRVVRYAGTAAILVLGTLAVLETLGILID